MQLIARCIALAIALVFAHAALAPAQASAAPRPAPATQAQTAQTCDSQPVVDTNVWSDGVIFELRECTQDLFQVTAYRNAIAAFGWDIQKAIAKTGEKVELMGHWIIPTYRCSKTGRPTMSCG